VRRLAQHVDLLPTLLSYLRLPVPAGLDGRDLLPLLAATGEAREMDGAAGADHVFSYLDNGATRAAAVTSGRWRYIHSRAPRPGDALYDRGGDPGERLDVFEEHPVEGGYLRALLRARESGREPSVTAVPAVIDDELRRELQALGYLGGS
jgi:arylsulfatase A-like enzyme